MLTYTALCDTVRRFLDAHPDAIDEEIRADLVNAYGPLESNQITRAIGTVRRARQQPATDAMRDTLHKAGIYIPPQAGAFPPELELTPAPAPARVYPSDQGHPSEVFIEAYDTLAAAYEHKVNARTREVYYRQLVLEEGCTVEECVAAVPFLLRAEGVWPRIAVWLRTVYTVRQHRARLTAGAQREPTVDAEGNAVWACTVCRDTGWRPECGCEVGTLVAGAGFCLLHPRIENGLHYRPRFTRCECQRGAHAAV